MALDIAGREKVEYKEGDSILFDINGEVKGEGIIRGRYAENVVDLWIVQVTKGNIDPAVYPFSCVVLPHIHLSKMG